MKFQITIDDEVKLCKGFNITCKYLESPENVMLQNKRIKSFIELNTNVGNNPTAYIFFTIGEMMLEMEVIDKLNKKIKEWNNENRAM